MLPLRIGVPCAEVVMIKLETEIEIRWSGRLP